MLPRHLTPILQESLEDTPVLMLVGARQVGKSTLAAGLTRADRHFTLDDLSTLAAARADPAGFLQALPSGALIDEIQRAPELLLPLKASVDRDRRPGRFLLTGSANVLTLPRVADSLAGRMSVHQLWPLSQGELAGVDEDFIAAAFGEDLPAATTPDDLLPRLLQGGYPEVVSRRSERRRAAWFTAYLRTLMERDVRDLSRISGVTELPRLLTLLALRSGNLLNASDLARDAGLNNVTLTRYVDLLRALFLVDTLPAWSTNAGKRLIKAPKVLLPDSGLSAHLQGLTLARLERDRSLLGGLLENFVVGELSRQRGWSAVDVALYHYRTAGGQEVDAVLEARDGRVVGVEVKASATVSNREFRGLQALQEDAGARFHRGVVLYTGERVLPFGERLHALPVGALWQWRG
ncbi:ATP-binding protein [Deinococcus sp. MIMF12]|uniref:ATP-binding protein n=1 Tax=Deinococcus rhizophilus TaxID=3049544 RepID=A0ABT7JII3_9DEIO|nr:ATP-binding protein [Deinococcus rhizophilus]MDL2344253.1 ATP-binding protein [Deinococcus rhizophilus]